MNIFGSSPINSNDIIRSGLILNSAVGILLYSVLNESRNLQHRLKDISLIITFE